MGQEGSTTAGNPLDNYIANEDRSQHEELIVSLQNYKFPTTRSKTLKEKKQGTMFCLTQDKSPNNSAHNLKKMAVSDEMAEVERVLSKVKSFDKKQQTGAPDKKQSQPTSPENTSDILSSPINSPREDEEAVVSYESLSTFRFPPAIHDLNSYRFPLTAV
jgi:hypothetical protein